MLFRNTEIYNYKWSQVDDSVLKRNYVPDMSKIPSGLTVPVAGFDFYGTLARHDEPEMLWDNVAETLKKYHNDGYVIAIFMNENRDKQEINGDIQRKVHEKLNFVDLVLHKLAVPVRIYMATRNDKYRKPSTRDESRGVKCGSGMWSLLADDLDTDGIKIDTDGSFFCGDEGGPDDYSDVDRKFAEAGNVKYIPVGNIFHNTD